MSDKADVIRNWVAKSHVDLDNLETSITRIREDISQVRFNLQQILFNLEEEATE